MAEAFSGAKVLAKTAVADVLGRARIAVFGLGGVGSCVAEALARCGVASLTLVDNGKVSVNDINRTFYALHSTVGESNVQVAKARIRDIDEEILVHTYETFYNEETAGMFDLSNYDYIVDTIDNAASKVLLIENAKRSKTPVISCMDVWDKLDPSRLEVMDISRTGVGPLARAVRTQLRKKGIRKVKVLCSREKNDWKTENSQEGDSLSFVVGTAGFMLAGAVVRDLLGKESDSQPRGKRMGRKNKNRKYEE